MAFTLHHRLAAGSHPLTIMSGCHILLKDNAVFPWLLIVPETDVEDLHQLTPERYEEVTAVIRKVSTFVSDYFQPEKLNVACIGNMVRQMHIHIVGRSASDPAWPGTVWASDAKSPWPQEQVDQIRQAALAVL
jgi:diadenosine tetraphosphate (Ap4A) HIT family hydrolase